MASEEKSIFSNGTEYKFSSSWINGLESERNWRNYWHQQSLMNNIVLPGHSVLELGVGSGFTSNYLRSKGINVTTLDIDAEKEPDIVSNIVDYQLDEKFDHILGFEVFEHIPLSKFIAIIPKLFQASNSYLFISLPINKRALLRAEIKLPFKKIISINLSLPKSKITTAHHYWEIDHPISLNNFILLMKGYGFFLERKFDFFPLMFLAFHK